MFRVRGQVVWIRHQLTGRERVVNRNKVKIVDPTIGWDDVRPRPIRTRPRIGPTLAVGLKISTPNVVNEEPPESPRSEEIPPVTPPPNEELVPTVSARTSRYLKRCQRGASPGIYEQKRQRLEAMELAAIFCR